MAAADYYESFSSTRTAEERLELQARDIDQRTLLLQAQLRGFLTRHRIYCPHRSDVARESNGRLASINKRSIIHSSAEIDQRVDRYTQRDNILWYKNRQGKADSTDLEARYQEPINSTANDIDKKDLNKVQTRSPFTSSDESAITEFQTTTSQEATMESAARMWGERKFASWWIENPSDSKESGLCNICKRINFDTLLHKIDALMYDTPIPLGTLQAIVRKTECSFCRLVVHTASRTLQYMEILESHGGAVYCELCDDVKGSRYATAIRHLCLKFTASLPYEHGTVSRHAFIQQILTSHERPPQQSQNDSRLVEDDIDLELVRCWLEICKEQHNSAYLKNTHRNGSFVPDAPTNIHDHSALIFQPCQPVPVNDVASEITLIDVKSECLVNMPMITTYIALSYVWGGPQSFRNVMSMKEELYNPHSIRVDDEAIPRTIQDAIRLTANLGERYIWVDSLCICQDEVENKRDQITNMGNIYSQALLTIVAASGSNANAGLPGVRAFSRNKAQRIEHVQGMLLANELPPLEDVIPQSYWNTRGWTYQEQELCKRYLIFCKTHVFFQCNRTVFKEDSGLRDHAISGGRALRIRGERHPVWNSYRRAVVKYSKRTLSDEADVVNAFQGILSLLQPAFKGDFLCGLPETELDIALLWQPNSIIRRRVDPKTRAPLFPSWSWAGWIGEVAYTWTRHQLDDLSRVEWQCTDSKGATIRFCRSDELRAPKDGDCGRWEYRAEETPYYYQHSDPDIWCLHPVAPKEKRNNRILLQPGSNRLIFRAYTAFFRILSVCCISLGDPLGANGRILFPLCIFDRDGFEAGRIFLPAHLVGTLESEFQEFVCLSRRRYNRLDGEPGPQSSEDDVKNIPDGVTLYPHSTSTAAIEDEFDHRRYNTYKPWPLYNVMMIGWDDGVASRIALGTLHVTAFVQAKPMMKVITLA